MDGRYAQNYQKINSKNYKNRRCAKPLIIVLFNFFVILRPIGRPPKKQAKKLFNADCAAVLPMNFKGKRCRDKYTWGRGVVFLSGSGLCYLYFIFTDNARPFEEYLKEIKGAFWLEKCKIKKEPML
jgi:hypothetical protein